ncbi:MAG TPA: BON domain-containing protein [Polyangiales bacterium]|nr:BON domain-containing protein [Polyangiales bacterium]
MDTHHVQLRRLGGLGALVGCVCWLTVGCASDQETRRPDPSARERSHENDEHVADRDRDLDRTEKRAENLDDHQVVPDATGAREIDVGKVKPVEVATPEQGAPDTDPQLTARIRKSIADDDRLSVSAKNVSVSSSPDTVTLRGSVKTAEEKTRVETYAQRAAGSRHVNNELEVRP